MVANPLTGRISSLGTPRTEVVEARWGDALARIAALLVVLALTVIGFATFWPLLLILAVVLLLVRGGRRVLGGSLMMLFALGRSRRDRRDPRELDIPVTPFTIRRSDGTQIEATLRGELAGGSLHLGDLVELTGRAGRDGVITCSEVRNETTGARTTVRRHPALARSRVKAIASCVVIVVVLAATYPYIESILR